MSDCLRRTWLLIAAFIVVGCGRTNAPEKTVSSESKQTMTSLNEADQKRMLDLETGKYWLDVLGMVKEKTNGNLHPQESRLLDGLLGDLRMQYVQLVRATEEKLKAQAAQQFSGADILGKK